jgi:hypothetical protein
LFSDFGAEFVSMKKNYVCFLLSSGLHISGGVELEMDLISLTLDGIAGFSREMVKFFVIFCVISAILIIFI